MNINALVNTLEDKLKQPLPGHDNFYTKIRGSSLKQDIPDINTTKKSAVLIAFYPHEGESYLPFILRPPYDGTHGGQMAFPGGRMEEVDESFTRTALREAEEEIGLKALDVNILGELTEIYIPPSNYWVKPIVGVLDYKPVFFPDEREVDRVLEVPLSRLMNPNALTERKISVRGTRLKTHGFEVEDQWIWGATALMIGELLEVLK
ncbi:NUDIX hydrolase [Jiulongibacter sp. NS-SX5]|uniref:NUDIX hydrolase n=1 Tax=Jiulongibacter sp. NS-SX5 TaxID=3463854 RepID=UPI0040592DA0